VRVGDGHAAVIPPFSEIGKGTLVATMLPLSASGGWEGS